MPVVTLADVGRYDALYLSPHADDAALSCLGRLRSGRVRGERSLVLVLFEDEALPLAEPLVDLGADVAVAGLPPAARRRAGAPYRSIAFERTADDDELFERLVRLLADVEPRVKPRQVCAPLGVGGHIDHRLVHEAALRALVGEPGRNVFLYEERPEAFAPGAVRVRLGLMGARLPPGATEAADRAGLARYALRAQSAPVLRGDLRGFGDRVATFSAAAEEWRSARVWNPQKAFGPRLQPVVQAADQDAAEGAQALFAQLLPGQAASRRAGERWRALATGYARKLGGADYAERYWLVLPALHGVDELTRREDLEAASLAR